MFKASGFNTKPETGCVSIPIPAFIQKIIIAACREEQVLVHTEVDGGCICKAQHPKSYCQCAIENFASLKNLIFPQGIAKKP